MPHVVVGKRADWVAGKRIATRLSGKCCHGQAANLAFCGPAPPASGLPWLDPRGGCPVKQRAIASNIASPEGQQGRYRAKSWAGRRQVPQAVFDAFAGQHSKRQGSPANNIERRWFRPAKLQCSQRSSRTPRLPESVDLVMAFALPGKTFPAGARAWPSGCVA